MKKELKRYFQKIGARGGKSTSTAKTNAVKRNLAKARAIRANQLEPIKNST